MTARFLILVRTLRRGDKPGTVVSLGLSGRWFPGVFSAGLYDSAQGAIHALRCVRLPFGAAEVLLVNELTGECDRMPPADFRGHL